MTSILIVEDELLVAMDTQALLKSHGYSVPAMAASGGEAVSQALSLRPDLVLMDIRLRGEMDGITAAAQILTHHSVPVIYLTAFADDATLLRARTTAPYGYLVKPFDESTLIASIAMAVERHSRDSRATARAELLSAVLDGSGDAVIAVDGNGMVTYLNPHATALLQEEPPTALGRPVAALVPLRDPNTGSLVPPPALEALLGSTVSPRPRLLDLCLPGKPARPVLVGTAPAAGPTGVTGAVMILWEKPQPGPRPGASQPRPQVEAREVAGHAPTHSREPRGAAQGERLSPACASLIAPGRVDRALKLHLLMVLFQHGQLRHDALSLSDWLKEPPWEVQVALSELAEAGLLYRGAEHPHPTYHLAGGAETDSMSSLFRAFDDPELRQLLIARVRAAEQERVLRQPASWEIME